ncbi:gamma-glutamylcyclotransferase family protein [Dietzia alimentaria]|uniref:gamma-glutamylcyclotransferase family protein n=1 Tax=Dietzia alimentaria TaxID=665550 RepID=UPI00029B1A17|nr:gamma-glutamylcyclotransferase family protein [Dietzia alimentaria]
MPLYAAYGTNMHPDQMNIRAPHSPFAGTGWLNGWRLTFAGNDPTWEGAVATVVEDPDSRVFVVLYDVPDEDARALDRWEGTDRIPAGKIRVRIQRRPTVPDGPPVSAQESEFAVETASPTGADDSVLAWLYVMDAFEGGLPSARYLGLLADAAECAGAPDPYVHELRTRESRNVGPGA